MNDIEQSGFAEFDEWRALARRTRELLDAAVLERALPAGGADFIADTTLPHIEGIQTGFVGWLRSDAAGVAELRYLLNLVGAAGSSPPRSPAERRAAAAERAHEALIAARDGVLSQSGAPRRRALEPRGAGPRAAGPGDAPGDPRRGRPLSGGPADLCRHPAAARPAELAGRLEELERQLWRTDRPRRTRWIPVPPRVRLLRRGRPARWPGARRRGLTIRRLGRHAAASERTRHGRLRAWPLVSSPGPDQTSA